jgi:HEAT repeat protein
MGDRFRLIYLKSPEIENAALEKSFSSHHPKETSSTVLPSSAHVNAPKTLSSQAVLKQAGIDLKHPDPKVRILAIQYLEKSDPSSAIPLLQEVLSDRDPAVRAQTLLSLTKFQDPVVCPLLRRHLKDSDPRVRIAALRGMFQFREKIDLNILLQLLSDESSRVRRKVATLLGWTQIEGAFPILMEMSKDQDSKVRKAALLSLITLYPDEIENRLIEAMTDVDPGLQKWARDTLGKMLTRPLKRGPAQLPNRA